MKDAGKGDGRRKNRNRPVARAAREETMLGLRMAAALPVPVGRDRPTSGHVVSDAWRIGHPGHAGHRGRSAHAGHAGHRIRISREQTRRKAVGADDDGERMPLRQHEAGGNQRTQSERRQHEVGGQLPCGEFEWTDSHHPEVIARDDLMVSQATGPVPRAAREPPRASRPPAHEPGGCHPRASRLPAHELRGVVTSLWACEPAGLRACGPPPASVPAAARKHPYRCSGDFPWTLVAADW